MPPCLAYRGSWGAADPSSYPGQPSKDQAYTPLLAGTHLAALCLVWGEPLTIWPLQHQIARFTSDQPVTIFDGLEQVIYLFCAFVPQV